MKPEKKQNRKNLIQAAALELFGAHGFSATTIVHIAEKTNLGTGTIYNYFHSKGHILLSIIEDRSFNYVSELDAVIQDPGLDLYKSTQKFIDSYLKSFSIYSKRIWRELLAAALSSEPDIMHSIYKIDEIYLKKFIELLVKFIALKELRRNIDVLAITGAMYSISMFTILKFVSEEKMAIETLRDDLNKFTVVLLDGYKVRR
jgi:AcrR family transcriptional regulator